MPDEKVTQLTEDTAPTSDDLFVTVNAPGTVPASRKVQGKNVFKSLYPTATELTIATDAITVTQNVHKLQPQSGTADDLSTISGTADGWTGVLYATDFGTDTITIKHNVGNILCVGGSDITLSNGIVFWYSNGTKVFMAGGGGTTAAAMPDGTMTNGKIAPSVATNNLTLALKTLAGTDPSASDPVNVWINGVKRTVTAALSVTKAAATNWCNAGSSELAAREIDFIAYLGYNATDGVVIGFSRIPYASLYSDFSATTTNEKYCAISTITNAVAGNDYVNIGRFAATLSAGAAYTWSVPTYTTANLIQRPIYETRWLSWLPTFTGFTATVPTGIYSYKLVGEMCLVSQLASTNGTSNATTFTQTYPFTFGSANASAGLMNAWDNGAGQAAIAQMQTTAASAVATYYKTFYQAAWTNAGAKNVYCPDFQYRLR